MKLDSNGEIIWSKPYSGLKIVALSDNGFVALILERPDSAIAVYSIIRFDENGNEIWKEGIEGISFYYGLYAGLMNFGSDFFVYTKYTAESTLELHVLNGDGEFINMVKTNLNFLAPRHFAITKTKDDGVLMVISKLAEVPEEPMTSIKISNDILIPRTSGN